MLRARGARNRDLARTVAEAAALPVPSAAGAGPAGYKNRGTIHMLGMKWDKRRHERFALAARCMILASDGHSLEARIIDASAFGMAVHIPSCLPAAYTYMLAVDLPRAERPVRLNAWGRGVYCNESVSGCRMGIEFVDMDSCSRSYFRFLESERRRK